jgi:hypothetical protein
MSQRLAAALFLLLWQAAAFAQGLYVHPASQLRFPAQLGGFKQGRIQDYGDPRLGISVGYAREGLGRADVYVYDLGERSIPTGINSDLVAAAFRSADRDILQYQQLGRYHDLRRMMPPGAMLNPARTGQGVLVGAYLLRIGDANAPPVVSWLAVTGYHNRFLKIRLTQSNAQAEDGEAALYDLINAFFEANK